MTYAAVIALVNSVSAAEEFLWKLFRLLLGGVADERIGLVEGGVMRRIARKLGIQTLGFRGRRFLAAERPGIRRRITFDRDGGV